jgi:DNA gyrase subunit B
MNSYNISHIESLTFKEGVRKRIAMYLGSADMQGVYHSIQEIISNSVDEYYMGHGNKIEITLGKDNCITIRDYGRGIPFGIRENGENVLEDIFSKSHTGGKFNDKVYQSVAGLNGIGGKATCLSSEKFACGVWRDGVYAEIRFEKGELIYYKENPTKEKQIGTQIQFIPDAEVFNLEEIKIEFDELCATCKNLSYLTKGLTFELEDLSGDKSIKKSYCAKGGLLDLIADNAEKSVHPNVIYYEISDGVNSVEVAMQWTKGREKSFCFTNGMHNVEGGTPITGIKTSITRNINKLLKKDFTGDMARTGLIYAVSCKVANPSFANQTKTKINNPELRSLADKAFAEGFNLFMDRYPSDIEKIKEFLLKEEKAEKAALKARQSVMDADKLTDKSKKEKAVLAGKLVDCEHHDEKSELFLVEGNSAAGSIIQARDSTYIACLPLRGKVINALKHSVEDVMMNQEIQDLIVGLGCGIFDKCNPKKMRYGKVCIFTDADVDGSSIMCLILTFFYKFMPALLEEGKIFWARAPLYKINNKTPGYAYDDIELAKLQKTISGSTTRFKGIGEMNPEDVKKTILSEDNCRLIRFCIEDGVKANAMFEMLMGEKVDDRKEFIFSNVDFDLLDE